MNAHWLALITIVLPALSTACVSVEGPETDVTGRRPSDATAEIVSATIGGAPNWGRWTRGEIVSPDLRETLRSETEKKWQYLGAYGQDGVVGVAIADTGCLQLTFAYVATSRDTWEFEKGPDPWGDVFVDRNVRAGLTVHDPNNLGALRAGESVTGSGARSEHLWIVNDVAGGRRWVHAVLPVKSANGCGDGVAILDFELATAGQQPLQVITPNSHTRTSFSADPLRHDGGGTFTHKAAGLRVRGGARILDEQGGLLDALQFDERTDRGAVDYTFGFPAKQMTWHWASLAGQARGPSGDPVEVGVNLVNAGHTHHKVWNENAIWLDGRPLPLAAAEFRVVDPGVAGAPTSIEEFEATWLHKKTYRLPEASDAMPDLSGSPLDFKNADRAIWLIRVGEELRLVFVPLGVRKDSTSMPLFGASLYLQPYGHYSGWVQREGAGLLTLDRVPGVTEFHYADW